MENLDTTVNWQSSPNRNFWRLRKSENILIPVSIFGSVIFITAYYLLVFAWPTPMVIKLFGHVLLIVPIYMLFLRFWLDFKKRSNTEYKMEEGVLKIVRNSKIENTLDLIKVNEIIITDRNYKDGLGTVIFVYNSITTIAPVHLLSSSYKTMFIFRFDHININEFLEVLKHNHFKGLIRNI